ncbi:hypothetical protein ACFP3I_02720 [Chryseobacterium arachidis]|uniref:hypothetical protein n=1 Tax=Chryseobacterium arachidis TaxID=1416778 RepID=UPI0009327536
MNYCIVCIDHYFSFALKQKKQKNCLRKVGEYYFKTWKLPLKLNFTPKISKTCANSIFAFQFNILIALQTVEIF